jgi:hypothetical protein
MRGDASSFKGLLPVVSFVLPAALMTMMLRVDMMEWYGGSSSMLVLMAKSGVFELQYCVLVATFYSWLMDCVLRVFMQPKLLSHADSLGTGRP